VLVDTGFGTLDMRDLSRLGSMNFILNARPDDEQPAIRQIERLGSRPEDVRSIFCTHLYRDHAGGLSDFPDARPVKARASALASGSLRWNPDAEMTGERLSRRAYEVAGLGHEAVDVAEVHDATAFGELLQCEELGFCPAGEGGPYAETGATKLGGDRPVNVSGGLECRGHPIGASGIAQLVELIDQLRGDAGKRQVEGARIAFAENGGGFIGAGEAAMCIHIFVSAN